jgi:hypothetical protein
MFTGSRPVPQPKWTTVWPRRTSTGNNPYMKSSSDCCEEGYEPLSTATFNTSVSEE